MKTKINFYTLMSCFVFLCTSVGNSQVITSAEYFINADPGAGHGSVIPVITAASINASFSIQATGLLPGFNQLFIRVKDQNNSWSIAEQRTFYIDNNLHAILPNLTAAEYFFDTDPGTGNANPFSIQNNDSINMLVNIHASTLADGFHQLFIRMKDQYNNWSIAEQRTFYIDNNLHAILPNLTAGEYFFDTDPGAGKATALGIQGNDSVSTLININASALAGGFHQLFIRLKDQYNNWSIVEQRTFYIDNNLQYKLVPLVAAEYFINADNGVGNGTPFTIIRANAVNSGYNFTVPNLPLGTYIMSVRLIDSTGNWSISESRRFTVCTTYGPISDFAFSMSNFAVSFTNNSSYAMSYHWIFGDGDTSNVVNPVHTYKPGQYKACLISKNECNTTGDTLCKSIAANAALPVSLANMRLNCIDGKVSLAWQTLSEINSSTFEIQRSTDGSGWYTIGSLNAAGYSATVNNYQFVDDHGSGTAFYRLRVIDKDGKSAYSEILMSNCLASAMNLLVYPIPSRDRVNILIKSVEEDHAVISLTDVSGKLVRQLNRSLQAGTNMLTMNASDLPSGEYFLKVQGTKFLHTQKVIIMH